MNGFCCLLRENLGGGGNIAPIFSTHASAIAEIKCRLLFVEEVTEAEDFPSRG